MPRTRKPKDQAPVDPPVDPPADPPKDEQPIDPPADDQPGGTYTDFDGSGQPIPGVIEGADPNEGVPPPPPDDEEEATIERPEVGAMIHSGAPDGTVHQVKLLADSLFMATCGRKYPIGPGVDPLAFGDAVLCQYCADGTEAPADAPEPVALRRADAAGPPADVEPVHTELVATLSAAMQVVLEALAAEPNATDAASVIALFESNLPTLRAMVPRRRGGNAPTTDRGQRLSVAANGRCPGVGTEATGAISEGFHRWSLCPACQTRRIVGKGGKFQSHPNKPAPARAPAAEADPPAEPPKEEATA